MNESPRWPAKRICLWAGTVAVCVLIPLSLNGVEKVREAAERTH